MDETNELVKGLSRKISASGLFLVLATRNYIECLENQDGDILTQIKIASDLGKDFLLAIDKKLSDEEKKYIDTYFSRYNNVYKLDINFTDKGLTELAKIIKILAVEKTGSDEHIEFHTQYNDR